jgi:hypothetical protein
MYRQQEIFSSAEPSPETKCAPSDAYEVRQPFAAFGYKVV